MTASMTTLYHATSADNARPIQLNGLKAGAFLTDREDVADYYAEGIAEDGGTPVILTIELDMLLDAVGETNLHPDNPSIAEPLSCTLGRSEAEIQDDWANAEGTWQECLELVGSIRVAVPIPASIISVSDYVLPSPPTTRV